MRVLFTSWEIDPFFKIGGLGDIARSLPIALHNKSVDIAVMCPFYKAIKFHGQKKEKIHTFAVKYDNDQVLISIYRIHFTHHKIPVYFLYNQQFFDVPQPDTFSLFDTAVVEIVKRNLLEWKPDIIHCNDHHMGLIPLLVKQMQVPVKTLLTIHNLFHQGKKSLKIVKKTGINPSSLHPIPWESKDKQINFLLEGILHADKVTTVSKTYAQEILTEEYGENLNEFIEPLSNKIEGILNGIDYEVTNPSHDPYIHTNFDIHHNDDILNLFEGKAANKEYLQKKLKFEINHDIPLIGFIGRFSPRQKGIELIHRMIRRIPLEKFQFVILGSGAADWEEKFKWLAQFYPKNVFYENQYNESLASQIYAGCDFLLIPSRFEPCGLIQMVAMRYGCLPIARATGGLKDSIEHDVNGFLFEKYSSQNLELKLRHACKLLLEEPKKIMTMRKNAMRKDFSWSKSAQEYIKVYQELIAE